MKKVLRLVGCLLLCEITLFNMIVFPASASSGNSRSDMPIVVSLGDSFSSGEGIEPYYDQYEEEDKKYTSEDWVAHRSTLAWPGLLEFDGAQLNTVRARNPVCSSTLSQTSGTSDGCWYFAAVSGAESMHIISMSDENTQQKKTVSQMRPLSDIQWNPVPDWNEQTHTLPYQIDIIQNLPDSAAVDLVTLTIGGNDMNFTGVMSEAVTKSPYHDWGWLKSSLFDELNKKIDNFWETTDGSVPMAQKLLETYTHILNEAPNATLIVAGYPELIYMDQYNEEKPDSITVCRQEAIWINKSIRIFNEFIRQIIENYLPTAMPGRTAIFVDVVDVFKTHGAYGPDPFINGVSLFFHENVDTGGFLGKAVNSKSFHPTKEGAQLYADEVQKELETIDYYNREFFISVRDSADNIYGDYTVRAQGKEFKGLLKTGLISSDYQVTLEGNGKTPLSLDLPKGNYTITVLDTKTQQTIGQDDIKVRETGARRSMLFLVNNATTTSEAIGSDVYAAYLAAARKTTQSGSWSENLSVTANMSITDSSGKTKTKLTLTSNADISDYSDSDLSQVRISGNAEMTAMGQTYAWKMRYENGMAHYDYTQPNQTSASMAIDPSFFNFGTMTSDMMTMAQLSGNQITFTVPGAKINEVGIAPVSQMSGVDDLDYGDVDVTVTISKDGTIDSIAMKFHASLSYQGYDADVDYDLVYQFTPHEGDTAEATTSPYDISNLVSDAYYDYVASTLYNAEGFYHIPKVNADLPEIDATNAKIYDDYYSYMQTHVYGPTNDGTKTGVEKISYIWGVKDSYLSILMSVVWGAEPMCEVYTVSLETGALIDNNDVLSAYDITLEGFNELAEQASRRLGDNIRWPVPYINPGNADLCAMGSSEEWGWSVLVNLTGTSEPVRPWDTKDVRPQVSEHTFVPDEELLTIQPGYYVEEGNANNTLTVHTVSDHSLTFSTFWYRVGDISKATATGIGEVVTFDHSGQNMRASGSIRFEEESAVLTLTDCNNPYISTGDYHFKLIGRVLTDKQLAEISAALGVPENLNVEITQGTPAYWEGGGFYRTNVEILHNGELIAGASVDSITGSLAGNIYTYSG